jgi:hypothetical protein
MSSLLPNQTQILSQLCSDPATLAETQLQQPRITIQQFLDNCFAFVSNHHKELAQHYIFEFSSLSASNPVLTKSNVLGACTTDKPVLRVDENLRFQGSTAGSVRVSDACTRTASTRGLQILVHGTYVYVILCGQIVYEGDVLNPSKRPPVGIAFYRHAWELPAAIIDHFETHVHKQKGFKYWHDATNRVLVALPESTERIFQRALFVWLDTHIVDKIRIYAEPRGLGQDATDVTVVTVTGDHIVEIKWLGKNASNTEYKQERINEGLRQVAIYLNNDPRAIRGYALLYDARCREDHEKESAFNPADRHPNCDEPIILFLESETPSQIAKTKPSKPQKPAKTKSA